MQLLIMYETNPVNYFTVHFNYIIRLYIISIVIAIVNINIQTISFWAMYFQLNVLIFLVFRSFFYLKYGKGQKIKNSNDLTNSLGLVNEL